MENDADGAQRALVALADAERITRAIRRDLRRRAIVDQLALGMRPELEHARPGSLATLLAMPAWVWMMWAAMVTLFMAPFPGALGAVAVAAAAALVIRTCLTVQHAAQLFVPDEAAVAELRGALATAGGAMRALPVDPYRGQPCEWVGDDPTTSEQPWTRLTTITRTAAALRRRALPAGSR